MAKRKLTKTDKVTLAFASTFLSRDGEVVLEELRNAFCGQAFRPTDTRCCQTAWRDGQRTVVLHIEALIAQALKLRSGDGSSSIAAGLDDESDAGVAE